MLSRFSCVQLFVTLWTVARQAPLSIEFSRQEYLSGLPCPPPGCLPNPGLKPMSPTSPSLQRELYCGATREAHYHAHTLKFFQVQTSAVFGVPQCLNTMLVSFLYLYAIL